MAYHFETNIDSDVFIESYERSEGEVLPEYVIAQAERYSDEEKKRLPTIVRVGVYDPSIPFRLPSVLGKPAAGCLFFSSEVKDILCELEPGAHELTPVEIRLFPQPVDQDIVLATYYMWYCPPSLVAIIPELSQYQQGFGLSARRESRGHLSSAESAPCVMRGSVIKGRHCWREIYSDTVLCPDGTSYVRNSFSFYCSAEFYSKVKFLQLAGFDFLKRCEVR